jgi:hypothetical protein
MSPKICVSSYAYNKVPFTGEDIGFSDITDFESLGVYLGYRSIFKVKQVGDNDPILSAGNEIKVKKLFTGELFRGY